ncbi:hypothetical protein [Aquipseudomonas ullengensis]|uniref:Filamentous hemagglutinin n=1 Tax=Aquipseudomonas ullengensis TaxID=2759166 RepID=A0A7W4QE47_9GAMM|nr:hypothetical protein [Pseudomonas ullengensis]MBB2496771.1 hypothetical protein [Pseudomonas ullengensis]
MPQIDIMSLVGSAVPAPLRASGHLACWYVLADGEPCAGPFTSRASAVAHKTVRQRQFGRR